jgi:hypothetical protein
MTSLTFSPVMPSRAVPQSQAHFGQHIAVAPAVVQLPPTTASQESVDTEISKTYLKPDKTHQLVADIGIHPGHYSDQGYFEKMSSGAVFNRKSVPLLAWPFGVASVAGLSTATGLLAHSAAAGATGAAFVASTGAAIGTGVGAGVLASLLAVWLGFAGYRSKKVMNGYKQSFNSLMAELMKPGNENMVSWYLRTKSVSSAKKKALKKNKETQDYLEGRKANPDNVFKIYMRHARNQNKVFVTRNPSYAALLLAEAQRVATGRIDTL